MSKVSVVILNWNGEGFLKMFVPVLVQHTSIDGVELVVADNASTDGSVEFITSTFPQIKLIRFNTNYGFAEGYNKALQQLSAEYFVLLNSDVELTPDWLMPIIRFMESDDKIGACAPKILSYYNKTQFEHAGASGGFIDKYGFPFCRGRILNVVEKDCGQYNDSIPVFWATGACMFVRASAYNQAGGLDANFFAHMEEIDLCWRMQWLGYKIMVYPQVAVYHVGGGALPKENPFKLYLNFRNNLFMLYKNLPAQKLAFTLFIRMCLDGIAALQFLAKCKFSFFVAVFKAHIHFYKQLAKLKKYRKSRSYNAKMTTFNGVYNKSIIFKFFIFRAKNFTDIYHQ